ncbi:MAG: DAK2 domain-containing protein [Frankiales bacterium]|nr:DAK2 domain-containing protein [Frankiales bacterium]
MPEALDAEALRRWCAWGHDALHAARAEIDALNVFPVADRDTGTNLLLTWEAVAGAGEDSAARTVAALIRELADAAVQAAAGNSGVILARYLVGLAEDWRWLDVAAATDVRRGLAAAAAGATAAVARPLEGTVLTVARAAAQGARAAEGADVALVLAAALAAAEQALARTPEQLTVLREAGVVDAAGRGLVVLLGALAGAAAGVRPEPPLPAAGVSPASPVPTTAAREVGSDGYGYEVQYLLDAPDAAVAGLRDVLARLGDSVAVAGGGGVHNVHVHVNDIGAAIEAGIAAGRPYRISVTRFADSATPPAPVAPTGSALVAVAPADGLAALFRAAGADVVPGGAGKACSTADLVTAMRRRGAAQVVLLPNDRDLVSRAEAAADVLRAGGATVAVLPSRSVVQGLAAVAVHDPARRFGDDVVAMSAAAAATRYGAVTRATSDAQTSAGRCRAGDILGLLDDDVALIGDDVADVSRGLLDRLLIGGGELVTLVTGVDAAADLAPGLADYLGVTRPVVEVVTYDGGQPLFPLLVGVE